MEIKKKIKRKGFVIFIIPFFFCQCNQESNGFFMVDYSRSSDVQKIAYEQITHIKHNLYKYHNRLFMADEYHELKLSYFTTEDRAEYVKKGLFLKDSIEKESVENVLDIESYEEISEYHIYKDKNNVYFLSNKCFLSCLYLLDVNVNTFKVLDENYEYASDGHKVFCLRDGKEIETEFPNTFHAVRLNGSTFGIDSTSIYSMCEPISPNDFKDNFESIPYEIRDSIVKQYFQ